VCGAGESCHWGVSDTPKGWKRRNREVRGPVRGSVRTLEHLCPRVTTRRRHRGARVTAPESTSTVSPSASRRAAVSTRLPPRPASLPSLKVALQGPGPAAAEPFFRSASVSTAAAERLRACVCGATGGARGWAACSSAHRPHASGPCGAPAMRRGWARGPQVARLRVLAGCCTSAGRIRRACTEPGPCTPSPPGPPHHVAATEKQGSSTVHGTATVTRCAREERRLGLQGGVYGRSLQMQPSLTSPSGLYTT
jgi:hypothetical protein